MDGKQLIAEVIRKPERSEHGREVLRPWVSALGIKDLGLRTAIAM